MRKLSMKIANGVGDFLKGSSISDISAGGDSSGKGSRKKKSIKKSASIMDASFVDSEKRDGSAVKGKRSSLADKSQKKADSVPDEEAPQEITWNTDVNRPHEDAAFDTEFLEMSIEKKRQRVNMEALHRAEKAKQ